MHQRLFTISKGSKAKYGRVEERRVINFGEDKATRRGTLKKKTAKEMIERDDIERATKGRPLFNAEQRKTLMRIAYKAEDDAPEWIGGKYDRQPYETMDMYYGRIRKMAGLDK